MENLINNLKSPLFIIDFVLTLVIAGLIVYLIIHLIKRKFVIWFYCALYFVLLVSMLFSFTYLNQITFASFIVGTVLVFFTNISTIREYLINPSALEKRETKRSKIVTSQMSKEEIYKIIDDTVHLLSKTKTGAILTFEKSNNLDEVIKSGTTLNAPLSSELLVTIFYPGTRLHDGAVVIRDSTIIAASVFYTPTTRALTGKYGSRHRAAIGISEVSDAVTIVVSEETGRISIAYNGELESVRLDTFKEEFEEYMNK